MLRGFVVGVAFVLVLVATLWLAAELLPVDEHNPMAPASQERR